MTDKRNLYIAALRSAIETAEGQRLQTPKDFDLLADRLFDKMHTHISPTTLKRLWGYVVGYAMPRMSTLDLLTQYIDYDSFDHFCNTCDISSISDNGTSNTEPSSLNPPPATFNPPPVSFNPPPAAKRGGHTPLLLLLLAVIVGQTVAVILLSHRQPAATADRDEAAAPALFIRLGQRFATYHDYLKLFGIYANDTLWGQRLPHHENISLWGPLYHHWKWHNDGDSALLMPTITEHWEPDDGSADSTLIAIRNNDHFIAQRDLNELRITFVRGLTPDGDSLTFCGVYRMDMSQSNFHHVTWMRVADHVDLNRLDYLEELRN